MATQYSNKPIVLDGLVYALDFGNQKSYVSGSSVARSLVFNPTPATFSTVPAGDYSGLAAAYSVRKVVSSYTGSAMQIRSASATLDIGFDSNGNLNTASIAAFAGSGDAFVRTWYDQSGNGRNAVQTDNAEQPKIYSGSQGSVVLENGRPAIHFNEKTINTTGFLNSDIANRGISAFSVYSAVSYNGGLYNVDFIYSTGGSGLSRLLELMILGPTATPQNYNSVIQFGQTEVRSTFTYGQKIFSQIGGNRTSSLFINSSISSSASPINWPAPEGSPHPIYLGSFGGGSRGNFKLQEFILYNTQQFANRTYIENNINSYYNAFTPTTDSTPTPTSSFLNFTSPDSIVTNQTFTGFSYDRGNSTIMYVGEIKGNSSLFTQDTNMSVVTTTSSVGFGSTSNNIGRTYPVTGLKHVTLRFSSGSVDCFVNGIPVPANSVFPTGSSVAGGRFAIPVYTGSLGLVQVYNRPLTGDEIWNNYQLTAPRYGLGALQNKPYSLDDNAYLFLSQSGITDPIITSSIDTFVRGLKSASLWDKMIAIYPFVGTGSVGTNLTGSHRWNLKEPSLVTYPLSFTGSWNGSTTGSLPSGSNTNITLGGITPSTVYPNYLTSSVHISILSYDTPVSRSYLMGTGMTEDLAASTLAGDYGTPAAAYSVRKVRTAYTGALMDVRRDSDNTTGSFGFDTLGNLDTGSLLAFVTGSDGTGSGFVARWYDQSGNNRHATQTATGSQPVIVLSGSIITENSRSALSFNGTSMFFDLSSNITATSPFSSFAVGRRSSNGTAMLFYGGSGVTHGLSVDDKYYLQKSTGYLQSNNTDTTNQQILLSGIATTTTQSQFKNSSEIASTFTAAGITTTVSKLGYYVPATPYYFNGKYQELSIYLTDQTNNRGPIEYGINSYYNIYPQTSSFATSSFTIYATSGSVSASLNNRLTSGIASSGPLGLITVSRTGSNSLTIARNGVTSSFAVPASGALSTGIYLGAINNNGLALANSPLGISFASVGTGLTNSDVQTLNRQIQLLKYNLQNPSIVTSGLVLNLDALIPSSYPGSGNTWFDLSSNNNNGTLTNGPVFTNDNGGAIVFDGTNDFISFQNLTTSNLGLNTSSGASLGCWLKLNLLSRYTGVFAFWSSGDQCDFGWDLTPANNIRLWKQSQTGLGITPYNNQWAYYVLTSSPTGVVFYINGVVSATWNNTNNVPFTSNRYLTFGDHWDSPIQGNSSQIQIYNRALTDAEVLQNFNATRGRFGV
jgi:hypothetical protein